MLLWIEEYARGIGSKKIIIEMKKYCLINGFTNVHSEKKSIEYTNESRRSGDYKTDSIILTINNNR